MPLRSWMATEFLQVRFPDDPKCAPQNDGEKPEKERLEPRSSELNAFSSSSDGLAHECVEDAPRGARNPKLSASMKRW